MNTPIPMHVKTAIFGASSVAQITHTEIAGAQVVVVVVVLINTNHNAVQPPLGSSPTPSAANFPKRSEEKAPRDPP